MSEFLNSLKSDLLERRVLVVLMLLTAALIGALAYALSAGSGSAPVPPPSAPGASSGASGIAPVAAAPSANQAVAETTSGSPRQRGGATRDPFVPLPGSPSLTASSSATSISKPSSSSAVSGPGAGKPTASSRPESTAPAAKKHAPAAKPRSVYHVVVLFGAIPAGTPPQSAPLTPYADLKLQQKLPSRKQPVLAFKGVTASGKRAAFKLVGEVILRGSSRCLPSATRCQELVLAQGGRVEFEFLPASGAPVVYELQVVSITSSKASAAAVRRSLGSRLHAPLAQPAAAAATHAST